MSAVPSPTPAATRPAPANPWLEIVVTIVAPSVVLMQLSDWLGPLPALLLALAFPLGWGLVQWRARRGFGVMAAIGVFSTALTGGIGLLQLDAHWLAVKEAAVPGVIGLAVAVSAWTRNPLIHALVYNPSLFDIERIDAALAARGSRVAFDERLRQGTLWLAGTFFFSSAVNWVLVRLIVTSPAGTPEFNAELGRLTLASYPAIALPQMVMLMALLWWLGRRASELTGLEIGDMLRDTRSG